MSDDNDSSNHSGETHNNIAGVVVGRVDCLRDFAIWRKVSSYA
jgi:hypothetical protein